MTTTFSCPDAPRVLLEASAEDRVRGISADYESLVPEVNYSTQKVNQLFDRMGVELNPNEGSWDVSDLPDVSRRLENLVLGNSSAPASATQLPPGVLPASFVEQATRETAYQAMQLLELVKAAQTHGYGVTWQ